MGEPSVAANAGKLRAERGANRQTRPSQQTNQRSTAYF